MTEIPPLLDLLRSGDFSDMKLKCDGKAFAVHKAILCAHSKVIAAALKGNFVEATTNTYEIKDFDVPTVQAMVDFIYTGNYKLDSKHEDSETSEEEESAGESCEEEIFGHIKVNGIANYFAISSLEQQSRAHIRSHLQDKWPKQAFPALVKKALDTSGDLELQDDLAKVASERMEDLVSVPEFFKIENAGEFYAALCNHSFRSCIKLTAGKAELDLKLQRSQQDQQARWDGISSCVTKLRDLKACRNCFRDFGGNIEALTSYRFMVRCDNCRCKH